jgi:hypothetical protein
VHVCRRWRYIIFESPIRLNLQLFCTETSPVRKLLDVWPPYPLVIRFKVDYSYFIVNLEPGIDSTVTDNLIGALERRDRVREIRVHITNPQNRLCERIIAAMEKPFPALRSFYFKSGDHSEEVILDTLSNGSAPCLRTLALWEISFPSLPRLLSSTSDLTSLCLFNAGYIRPETMATSLSALPKLECLIIAFETSTPHLKRRNRAPPLQTRFVLPALTSIAFYGVSEYLEVLADRFDAPLLDEFQIKFFHHDDHRVFDIPQTVRLLSHIDSFKASSLTLNFHPSDQVHIHFPSNTTHHFGGPIQSWDIVWCHTFDQKVISVTQICSQILPFRSSVKTLSIKCDNSHWHSFDLQIDPTLWLQLFHSFPSVQILQIPVALEPFIVPVLEGSAKELPTPPEAFPSLHTLSILERKSGETMQQPNPSSSVATTLQRSGRTVAVSRTFY